MLCCAVMQVAAGRRKLFRGGECCLEVIQQYSARKRGCLSQPSQPTTRTVSTRSVLVLSYTDGTRDVSALSTTACGCVGIGACQIVSILVHGTVRYGADTGKA